MTQSLISLIQLASVLLTALILARVIMSWVNPNPGNLIVNFIYRSTEPLLKPIRDRLPVMGGLDLAPMVVILTVLVLERLLIRLVVGM